LKRGPMAAAAPVLPFKSPRRARTAARDDRFPQFHWAAPREVGPVRSNPSPGDGGVGAGRT